MSKKKNYEYHDTRYSRDGDGLKQRRLKEESRWRFNPNSTYVEETDDMDDDDGYRHEYQDDEYQ